MKNILIDMDGVVLHDNSLIAGADHFLHRIMKQGNPFLFITNYPSQTAADLRNRLMTSGIDIPDKHFYTSAMATAAFLAKQKGKKAYVIGEGALTHELYSIGFTLTDINPDFVVVGETQSFNWDMIKKAAGLIMKGARFIATNPDVAGPSGSPACGALCAPIERITGKKPFIIGKPSPFMMRAALNSMNAHSHNTVIIGDNMNTDILAGIQAGMETVLVLSGVSQMPDLDQYPFMPNHIFDTLADVDIV